MTLTATDLKSLFDAFNRHDIDGIMHFFAEDCVFNAVGGPEVYGVRFEGRQAIADAFSGVWKAIFTSDLVAARAGVSDRGRPRRAVRRRGS